MLQIYPETAQKTPEEINCAIDAILQNIRKASVTGLHIGCANNIIPELINCDRFNSAADLKMDAADLHMVSDCSVDVIETHHMIEHLSFEQAQKAVVEWARALKPDGYLIITCPDLDRIALLWNEYKNTETDTEFRDYILKMIFGSQEHDGMFHRSGYNLSVLSEMLTGAGFTVDFSFAPYPADRTTPSMIIIARKKERDIKRTKNDDTPQPLVNEFFRDKRISDSISAYHGFKERIARFVHENKQDGACAVYGTGDLCEVVVAALKEISPVCAIIDRDEHKWPSHLSGVPVIGLSDIDSYQIKNIIIASVAHKKAIYERLCNELQGQAIKLLSLDL